MFENIWTHFDEKHPYCISFKDKITLMTYHTRQMLKRTNTMFSYGNMPNTIKRMIMEQYIQVKGYIGIIKHKGKYYATFGGIGAGLNYNYLPLKFIVTNPYIDGGLNKEYWIYYGGELEHNVDDYCIVIPNDPYYEGLMPIMEYYSSRLATNDISLNMIMINSRAQNVFIAKDNNDALSIIEFQKDIENGKPSQVLSKSILDNVEALPYSGNGAYNIIREFIESEQFIKAGFFNALGLQANYNMKRESLNSNENQLNEDMLKPLIDVMLELRQENIELANKLWNTDWTIELDSVWKTNELQAQAELENLDDNDDVNTDEAKSKRLDSEENDDENNDSK